MIASHYLQCFGCGPEVAAGLHIRVIVGPGVSVRAAFEVGEQHQGAPGLAHGGILAAAFDEALGALNWLLLAPAVTGRLETDFRRPVPVGSVIDIEAEIVAVAGRKVYTRGVGVVDGAVVATASALFVQVDRSHFTTHGRPPVGTDLGPPAPGAMLDMNP